MKGVVSGTVLVKPPTHPPEDRIGHHAQGLSLKLQLLAGTPPPPTRPSAPGPWPAWACAGEGAGASQQGQMPAWVGFCSLTPPHTDAWGGGQCRWDPPLMLRPRGAKEARIPTSVSGVQDTHTPNGPFLGYRT